MQNTIVKLQDVKCTARFREDYGDLEGLSKSIQEHGVIQPLAVMEEADGTFVLLAGGRRYEACKAAGLTDIPVRIYPPQMSSIEQRSIELAENIFRKDLTWTEEVRLKKEINDLQVEIHGHKTNLLDPDAPGWTQAKTAEMLGESAMNVSRDIRLAEALDKVPGLADICDSKADAVKLLKRIGANLTAKDTAARIQAERENTPLRMQQQRLIDAYIIGDFFTKIKDVPAGYVDIVEMDPPYSIDIVGTRETRGGVGNAIGYSEVDRSKYVDFLKATFSELYRVMKPDSWLVCWYAIYPWHDTVLALIEKAGFRTQGIPAIWLKSAGPTMSPSTMLGSSYEPFFYARKGNALLNKQGRGNVYSYGRPSSLTRIHPTERPIELIQDVIETFVQPGTRILVPFLGSGNTLLAASNLGMQGFGYDLGDNYKDKYIIRVSKGTPGLYKSFSKEEEV